MSFIIISIIILIIISVLYLASFWIGSKAGYSEKLSIYECGFEPIGDARMKFDLIFWIIGIFYLIFDLEIIFLFPFGSIIFNLDSYLAIWIALLFLSILTLGFVYEWKQGALEINLKNY